MYRGPFGAKEAERLLWRAGFGPRPGKWSGSRSSASTALSCSLTRPPKERLTGPRPHDDDGRPLAPADAYGHDHLWWLDRMVRTNRPARRADDARLARLVRDLERRSRLAAADVASRTGCCRRHALGIVRASCSTTITHDPAMLRLALGHRQHEVVAERELRPRADGAVHARRRPRLHRARRPRAGARADRLRATTGDDGDRPDELPLRPRAPRPRRQDDLRQARHASTGATRAGSACATRATRPSSCDKLWRYFVPTAPPRRTRRALERLYVGADYASARSSRRSSATRPSTSARAW